MADRKALRLFLDGATVSQEVFKLRPDYRALLIAVAGASTVPSTGYSESLLSGAEQSVRTVLKSTPVTEIPHVAAWREAYKAFGTKPNKYRNSLEALVRRVEKGLPRVNHMTDIYNAISIKHGIPLGGEDLELYQGAARLICATGQEKFETSSEGQPLVEHPDPGEVVWCDDQGVTCRRWNWRQGPRTALSDKTTQALFILDALDPLTDEELTEAGRELVEAIKHSSPDLIAESRLLRKGESD